MQSLGYQHCTAVVAGWQKDQKMNRLLSTQNEDNRKHMLEKFDKLSKQNSNSVRDLVRLAAQISHPQPEDSGVRGYWSNPEDQVLSRIGVSGLNNFSPTDLLQ